VIRRIALLALIGGAAIAAPSASGSPSASHPIRVGVGIGPVNIGMTGAQVYKALGRPRAVSERRVVRGQPYVEFEYDFGAWNIGFLGQKGRRRVVLVGTGLARHKTPEGVGVGTNGQRFWRQMRDDGYRERTCEDRPGTSHWVLRRGASETVFFPYYPCGWCGQLGPVRIVGVEVRAAPAVGCAF
jgi:hypothetical protein